MDNKHQKHEKLSRPDVGEWGRNELTFIGTTCDDIRNLACEIAQHLSPSKIAYTDADHKAADTNRQSVSSMDTGIYATYTDKISYKQLNTNAHLNSFQKRVLFNDYDLILVNGNHFSASKQVVVIDDRKPLEKKLDKLTDVQLILLRNFTSEIPGFVSRHLSHLSSVPVLPFDDVESITRWFKNFIQQAIPPINGLVLAGGKSTRMGSDKSKLIYHETTQRQHVYQLLQAHCSEVYLSLNEQQTKEANKLPYVQDAFLGLGPAGGILSAFQQNPNTAWLTVACDLPYLSDNIIRYLTHHRNPAKIATAFMDADNKFPEPLVTIWEPKAYPVLLQFLSQGYSCPRKVLINSDVELLQSPDAAAFANINTGEEYEKVRNSLQQEA